MINKEHKRIITAYNMKMKLTRIVLDYEGSFYYHCIDNNNRNWVLQPHEIQSWE